MLTGHITWKSIHFFPAPAYNYLIKGKGEPAPKRGWTLYEQKDFLPTYFPSGWDVLLNSHGEGLKIAYPVMMRTYMSKSPPKYTTQSTTDGDVVVLDHYNHYEHKVSLVFTKTAV